MRAHPGAPHQGLFRVRAHTPSQDTREACMGARLGSGKGWLIEPHMRLIGVGRLLHALRARPVCVWVRARVFTLWARATCALSASAHTAGLCLWRSSTWRRVAWVCTRWLWELHYFAHIKLKTLKTNTLPLTHRVSHPFLVHTRAESIQRARVG